LSDVCFLCSRDSDPFHLSPIRHHFRTTPAARTQTRIVSARARWEAGDDLDFQDDDLGLNSGHDEHNSHEDVAGCTRSGDKQNHVPSNDPNPHPPADVQRDLATEYSTELQVSSEPPPSDTPMSSPSFYASTETSHSAPYSIGSTPSDTQPCPLNHQPATSVSPAVLPSRPSTPTSTLETSATASGVVQQPSLSSWSLQPKAHMKQVRFLSREATYTYEPSVLAPGEGHTRRADRTLSYQFI